MKNRSKQRLNRKNKQVLLDRRDICGVKDPTPYEAVKKIIQESQRQPKRDALTYPIPTKLTRNDKH